MNTEFLKGLGITDQDVINAIFAENGKDVNKAKGDSEQLTSKVTALEEQLAERDEQLEKLKESAKDNEKLQKKLDELQDENKATAQKYAEQLSALEKTHAIETAIRDAKPRNLKAVQALLDMDKISYVNGKLEGLESQLKGLLEGEDTKFLFEETSAPKPSGAKPNNPDGLPNGGDDAPKDLASAVAAALKAQ